jgi:CRP/FNR family transcriptional regulator, cyclic AMP receptor protein
MQKWRMLDALPLDASADLTVRAQRLDLRAGEVVCREGADDRRLFVVESGAVDLFHEGNGRRRLVHVARSGEHFGEVAALDGGHCATTAEARVASRLAAFSPEALGLWLAAHPQAAEVLLRALSRRVKELDDRVATTVFDDVPGRLARALVRWGAQYGDVLEGSCYLRHGLTQAELASLIGAGRESVNKALRNFAARGWITQDVSGSLVLRRVDYLRRRGNLVAAAQRAR